MADHAGLLLRLQLWREMKSAMPEADKELREALIKAEEEVRVELVGLFRKHKRPPGFIAT